MRAWQQVGGLALLAAGLPAFAADHRDAPAMRERPVADINDVYAFLAPDDPDQLVLAMTINPVSDPGFCSHLRVLARRAVPVHDRQRRRSAARAHDRRRFQPLS
jgi:hypothetical protein